MKIIVLWTVIMIFLGYTLMMGYAMVFNQARWKGSKFIVRGRLDNLDMSLAENRVHIRILGGLFIAFALYTIGCIVRPIISRMGG
jgi:hypothetical protein